MKAVKNTRSTLVLFCMVFALIEALESDNNNNRPEPSIKRTQNAKLFYSKECQDDINRYCLSLSKSLTELSDLAVLQCIHNKVPDLNLIDKECHHVKNNNLYLPLVLSGHMIIVILFKMFSSSMRLRRI